MNLIVIIVISLTVLFVLVGAWLSLPVGVPLAPSRRFIDSLPTWLQGPRRIAPTVKEESVSFPGEIHASQVASAFFPVALPTIDEDHEEAAQPEVVRDEP